MWQKKRILLLHNSYIYPDTLKVLWLHTCNFYCVNTKNVSSVCAHMNYVQGMLYVAIDTQFSCSSSA